MGENKTLANLQEAVHVGEYYLEGFMEAVSGCRTPQDHRTEAVRFLNKVGIKTATVETLKGMDVQMFPELIDATMCYPETWIEASNKFDPPLSFEMRTNLNKGVKGYYDRNSGVITYSSKLRGEGLAAHLAHEIAHRMEAVMPERLNHTSHLASILRTTLTSGEREKVFTYPDPEREYREDEFAKWYMGRIYEDIDKQELFSVGCELMFYGVDGEFEKAMEDRSSISMVLGMFGINKRGK